MGDEVADQIIFLLGKRKAFAKNLVQRDEEELDDSLYYLQERHTQSINDGDEGNTLLSSFTGEVSRYGSSSYEKDTVSQNTFLFPMKSIKNVILFPLSVIQGFEFVRLNLDCLLICAELQAPQAVPLLEIIQNSYASLFHAKSGNWKRLCTRARSFPGLILRVQLLALLAAEEHSTNFSWADLGLPWMDVVSVSHANIDVLADTFVATWGKNGLAGSLERTALFGDGGPVGVDPDTETLVRSLGMSILLRVLGDPSYGVLRLCEVTCTLDRQIQMQRDTQRDT